MHEAFNRHADTVADILDFGYCQLACQHNLRTAHRFQESGLIRRTCVALRGCVQCDGRDVHAQYRHVLHYQRVDSGFIQTAYQFAHLLQLVVVDQSIDRDIDTGAISVRELHYLAYILY